MLWAILMEMKVSQVGCFQITDRWICYSIFFDISFIVFHKAFVKKFLKKLSFFSSNFKNLFQDELLQKIRMSNFVILKWRLFEYKVKSWKICPFLGLFWIFMTQIFWKWFLVPHKMTYMGLLLLKLRLDKLESRLLSSNWYIF